MLLKSTGLEASSSPASFEPPDVHTPDGSTHVVPRTRSSASMRWRLADGTAGEERGEPTKSGSHGEKALLQGRGEEGFSRTVLPLR